MLLQTNAGVLKCDLEGYLANYGWVWFNPQAITNILSLSNVAKKHRVTFDSHGDNIFHVHVANKPTLDFRLHDNGLYYKDCSPNKGVALISTVSENKKNFMKTQVDRANLAQKVHKILMFPSIRDFKHLLMTNGIKNCPITIEDINISEKIYGLNVYSIKGKSTRSNPTPKVDDRIEIPPELKIAHQKVALCVDTMYVQGVMFLITISKNIHLIMVTHVHTQSAGVLSEAFDEVF